MLRRTPSPERLLEACISSVRTLLDQPGLPPNDEQSLYEALCALEITIARQKRRKHRRQA